MCWSTGREPIAQPPGSDTVRLAEARQQRPEHQDRGAHGLDQLVRRLRACQRATASMRHLVGRRRRRSTATPMLRSSLSMVATSCRRGTLCSVTGSAVSSAAHRSAAPRSWRRRCATSPREAAAAADQQFVHDESSCPAAFRCGSWPAAHSSGVSVFIDSAWISSRMRSPERRVDQLVALDGRLPSNSAETMVAKSGGRRPRPRGARRRGPPAMMDLEFFAVMYAYQSWVWLPRIL